MFKHPIIIPLILLFSLNTLCAKNLHPIGVLITNHHSEDRIISVQIDENQKFDLVVPSKKMLFIEQSESKEFKFKSMNYKGGSHSSENTGRVDLQLGKRGTVAGTAPFSEDEFNPKDGLSVPGRIPYVSNDVIRIILDYREISFHFDSRDQEK
jgi:hypothetical protein